jgi:hypothetical protein
MRTRLLSAISAVVVIALIALIATRLLTVPAADSVCARQLSVSFPPI